MSTHGSLRQHLQSAHHNQRHHCTPDWITVGSRETRLNQGTPARTKALCEKHSEEGQGLPELSSDKPLSPSTSGPVKAFSCAERKTSCQKHSLRRTRSTSPSFDRMFLIQVRLLPTWVRHKITRTEYDLCPSTKARNRHIARWSPRKPAYQEATGGQTYEF